MALSNELIKRLGQAVTDRALGEELVDAIQAGQDAGAVLGDAGWKIANLIICTNVSQTVDFGSLLIGDRVLMIPASAGSADLITIAGVDADLGQAGVVGNAYLVLRAYTAPAASAIVW